jgi:hypothetical protein
MRDSATVEWVSAAIGEAIKSAKFCVAGTLPDIDPGIEIEGLGAITFPLKRTRAKELVSTCQMAPYGKGTDTLVDTKVRNTFELDPKKFHLSDVWNSAIDNAMLHVAEQLGLPAEQLEARLYKLLVYEKGGFFLPHRDSEKHDRMLASMIVVLPNRFEGGELIVRHGAAEEKLTFDEAANGKAPCYAAFYADCEHEVQRVIHGVRLCLAYNLVLKPRRGKSSDVAKPATPVDALAESIRSWIAKQPTTPLVFALEHHYTERGLSLDLFKGVDRQLADLVVSAAKKMDCLVYLAQVSRHLLQHADDGSFGYSYSRHYRPPRRGPIEIGETYEDELFGMQWTDVEGEKQPWESIAFDLSAIVSSVPIDDWKPTSEEFEGYTGNAGNTLDRWYHRSAIVIWPRDHHFDVVASSGARNSVPLFSSMAAKLTKTPKKRLEVARNDCICFARAIVEVWPHQVNYWYSVPHDKTSLDDFPEHLLMLHDRDTVAMFLKKLSERDESLQLSSFIVAACREFGWCAFAPELKLLISSQPIESRREEIPFRDIEWLSAFCCEKTEDADKSALAAELCVLADDRFCRPRSRGSKYYTADYQREPTVSEKSLPLLIKALLASGCDEELSRVLKFVRESQNEFTIDDCLVPSLKTLVPWSKKQFGSVHPQLASWLTAVRQQLESATAKQPTPPADWTRPAEVDCKCQYCAQLNAFLADPANQVGRIAAREDLRRHVMNNADQHQSDVKYVLERKGSPFSLVFTKTNGSFERRLKRFEADLRLLSELPEVE